MAPDLGDLTIGVGFVINQADLTAKLRQAEQLVNIKPVQIKVGLDVTQVQSQIQQAIANVGRNAAIKLRLDTTSIIADVQRIQGLAGRAVNINVRVTGTTAAMNDVTTLRNLLTSLQGASTLRITTDVTALQAVNAQISTQIAQLTALIAQLRGLGGGSGSGGQGGPGSGLPAAVRATLLEVERLNNLWNRGQIGAQNYNQALTAMQSRLEAARSAAGRGTTEFAQIDKQITKLTQSLRSINTDNFQKIRADMTAIRTAFDQATGGISRDSQQFRDAAAVWQTGAAQVEARLRALLAQGNLLPNQMRQINAALGTLAREQGTLTGGVNSMGLSGNAFNAIRAAFPLLMQAGGSLGAAAASANMFGQGMASAGAAAGPLGLAVGAVVVSLGLFVKTASEGLEQVKQLGNAFAVLKANGETNLAGVTAGIERLKQSGNAAAETFTKGQLGAALADVVKAGVSTSDAMRLMATSTRLAASENQDLTVSSSMLLKNLRQYQLGVGDAAKVGDMLAESGLLAAGSVADLSTGMGIVAGTGRAAKVEMYDLLGMLVELDNKGMSAADVGANGLRAALAALAGITDKGRAALHALGIETLDAGGHSRAAGDIMVELSAKLQGMGIKADASTGMLVGNGDALAKVSDIMDTRAAAAILNLTGDWKTYSEQIHNSQGRLTSYSNTMLDTLDGNQRRLAASLKDLGGNITQFLANPISNAANAFNDLITQMNGGTAGFSRYLQQAGIDGTSLDGTVNAHLQALFKQREMMQNRIDQLDQAPALKFFFQAQYKDFSTQLPLVVAEMKRIVGDARSGKQSTLTTSGADGGQVALDTTIGSKVVDATRKPLDDAEAQSLVDRCDKYVRLVLGKAFPSIANQINALFQANPGRDGVPTAVTSAANLSAAGLLHPFSGTGELKKGDVIFYTDKGQNHTGVWLGEGNYVRGNNRVTAGLTGGKQVVGDVDINALGTPTSVLSIAELAARYGIKAPPSPAPVKPVVNTTAAPVADDPNAAIKKVQAEGLHLYNQYEAALASGNKVWRDKAKMAVDAFKKENKAVWDGILKDHKSGGDEQVGLTAAQITKAQRLNAAYAAAQQALKLHPTDVADTKAYDQAKSAMERWSKASEGNARALAAVQESQTGLNKSSKDYIATTADLRKYGDDALILIKRQEEAQKSGNADRIEAARGAIALFTGDSKARAAVLAAEQAAYQSRNQMRAQTDADAKTARTRAAALASDIRAGSLTAAQEALKQVENLKEKELAAASNSAAKQLEITTRYAALEYAAKEKVAAKTRDNAIRDAQNKYTDDPKNLALATANANANYKNTMVKAAVDRDKAISDVEKQGHDTRLARQKEQAAIVARLTDELRQGNIQKAQDELTKLQQLRERDLAGVKDNVAERLRLTREAGEQEYQAAVKIADAIRNKALKDAANKHTLNTPLDNAAQRAEEAAAQRAYALAVGAAAATRDSGNTTATEAQTQAIQKQRDSLHQLAEQIRTNIATGTYSEEQRQKDIDSLHALDAEAAKYGLTTERNTILARNTVSSLIATATSVDKATAAYEAYWKAQDARQNSEGQADAGMRGSYGVGQEGLQAALAGSGANRKLLGDPQAALSDLDTFNRAAADRIRRVYSDELAEFQHYHDAVNAGVLETTTAAYAQIKQASQDAQEEADDAGTTVESLTAMQDRVVANGLDPSTSGFVQLLDEIIVKGGQAADAAQLVKDNLDAISKAKFANGLIEENARNGAYDNVSDGGRTGKGTDFQTLPVNEQTQAYLNLDEVIKNINSLAPETFQALIRGSSLSADEAQRLAEAWQAANKDLGDYYTNAENYADGARGLKARPVGPTSQQQSDTFAGLASTIQDMRDQLTDPEAVTAFKDALALTAQQGNITNAQLQVLLTTLDNLNAALPETPLTHAQQTFESTAQSIDGLVASYQDGEISAQDFGTQVTDLLPKLDALAKAADANGDTDLAALYRAAAAGLREMVPPASQLVTTLDKISRGMDIAGKLFDRFSGGEVTAAGTAFDYMKMNVTAASQALKGDWLGAIETTINGIGDLAEKLFGLSDAVKANRKELMALADLESGAAGSKKTGLFSNPYYDALQEDATKRQSLAKAGFWQRLGWNLFGGAPEVLSSEAAKLKSAAATIFNDLGTGISNSLSSNLLSAVKSGDFSSINDVLKKELDDFVTKAAIDEVIAKSNLTALISTYADDAAAGRDTTTDLAAIRTEENRVTATVQGMSSSLPSYGNVPSTDMTAPSSGTAFGQQAAAMEFSLPPIVYQGFSTFDSSTVMFRDTIGEARAMYQEVAAMYKGVAAAFERGFGMDITLAPGVQSVQARSTTGPLR